MLEIKSTKWFFFFLIKIVSNNHYDNMILRSTIQTQLHYMFKRIGIQKNYCVCVNDIAAVNRIFKVVYYIKCIHLLKRIGAKNNSDEKCRKNYGGNRYEKNKIKILIIEISYKNRSDGVMIIFC